MPCINPERRNLSFTAWETRRIFLQLNSFDIVLRILAVAFPLQAISRTDVPRKSNYQLSHRNPNLASRQYIEFEYLQRKRFFPLVWVLVLNFKKQKRV